MLCALMFRRLVRPAAWLLLAAVAGPGLVPDPVRAQPPVNGTGTGAEQPQQTALAAEEVTRLHGMWSAWRERIKTYRIRGWRFLGGHRTADNAVSRDDLLSLLKSDVVPLMEATAREGTPLDETRLTRLMSPLFPVAPESGRYGVWQRFELAGTLDDRVARYSFGGDQRVLVRKDGQEQEYKSLSRQVSIRPTASPLQMEELSDFLHTPDLPALTRVESVEGGRRVLTNRSGDEECRLEYAPASGFVFRDTRRIGPSWYAAERICELPLITAEDVPFPRVAAQVHYHRSADSPVRVRMLLLYLVEHVTLNDAITDSEFEIAVPAGTTIVDFGRELPERSAESPPRHVAERLTKPASDALERSKRIASAADHAAVQWPRANLERHRRARGCSRG